MHTKYLFSFLICTLLAFSTLPAQDADQRMDLDACIQYALSNNRQIQNSRFDEYIAQARVKEIQSAGYPQINGSADLQYFAALPTSILPGIFNTQQELVTVDGITFPVTKLDPETFQPIPGDPVALEFGFPWQSTLGFQANQLVFDGTFFLGLKAARAYVDLSKINTQRTQEEIALNVSKAYYQALITQEQINLIEANLNRITKLFDETNILNQNGFVEKIDVDRLRISKTNLELEKSKLERFAALSINLLKFQMGMPITETITMTEKAIELTEQPDFQLDLSSFDPNNRVEYSLLKSQRALETYNLKRYKVGYYPSLYAFGSYQWNAQRGEFNLFNTDEQWFPIAVFGLQLNVPIFDGFRKQAQSEQSRLTLKKIDNQMDILQQSIQLELTNTQTTLLNAFQNLEAYQRNAELARKVFEVSQIKYKEGVGASLEVNEAESQLKQAESAYLSGLFEYLMAKLDWQKANGEFSKYHQEKE